MWEARKFSILSLELSAAWPSKYSAVRASKPIRRGVKYLAIVTDNGSARDSHGRTTELLAGCEHEVGNRVQVASPFPKAEQLRGLQTSRLKEQSECETFLLRAGAQNCHLPSQLVNLNPAFYIARKMWFRRSKAESEATLWPR